MSSGTETVRPNGRQSIRARIDWVAHLPKTEFRLDDDYDSLEYWDEVGDALIKMLMNNLIVEVVRKEDQYVYRITDAARREYDRHVKGGNRRIESPCGHGGIRNTTEGYQCNFPPCDRVFTRQEVESEQ